MPNEKFEEFRLMWNAANCDICMENRDACSQCKRLDTFMSEWHAFNEGSKGCKNDS